MKRIAVFGASGFVGSTLAERIVEAGKDEVVPFIHSTGNGWRLARRGIPLRLIDVCNADEVLKALAGCTHVVNCTRGGADVMFGGLRNLLAASQKQKVVRFVHLSSVMVYGDLPHLDSRTEAAPTKPAKNTYGWIKLKQDEMVQKAAQNGLQATILCPPNISGAYSGYLTEILHALGRSRFVLMDDGSAPCNLVDVNNLCRAIELSLDATTVSGIRMFVTDGDQSSWKRLVEELTPLLEVRGTPPKVSRDDLMAFAVVDGPSRASLFGALKHLASSDVRQALRRDPLWRKLDGAFRAGISALGSSIEDRLRLTMQAEPARRQSPSCPHFEVRLCMQQLRGVVHSCELARRHIGYHPECSFSESMESFRTWYRQRHAMDSKYWDLLRRLY